MRYGYCRCSTNEKKQDIDRQKRELTAEGAEIIFFEYEHRDKADKKELNKLLDITKQGDEIIGNRTRVKIMKNKVAPPFKVAEFDIMYNEGISKVGNIVDVGVKESIVQKSGAWFSYNDIRLGQGRENAKQYLRENPEIALEIENQIRSKYDLPINQDNVKVASEKAEE